MNQNQNIEFISQLWEDSIIPVLMEYITIPNKSPQFDPDWHVHGYMDRAVNLISHWCKSQAIEKMKIDVVRLPDRTPVIFMDIPGLNTDETVLLYGHLDKQPEMSGWDEDLSPWRSVLRDDRLYGRGAADDGYAVFAAITAIKSLQKQQVPHARCIILIECCEESGSVDLPFYIEELKDRIGKPSLVIGLDSGCGNYDQLWTTTSLRGLVTAVLQIDVLTQGVHSGSGSGVAPSCFQVLRTLLARLENDAGDIILKDLFVDIPEQREEQAKHAAEILGEHVFNDLPFCDGVKPRPGSIANLILNRTWRPALSVIGLDGLPLVENAGNVTIPSLTVKLSMRLPPTCDAKKAAQAIKATLEKNPPFQTKVECHIPEKANGWNAPEESAWLINASNHASLDYFGKPAVGMGEGGSIPFMGMLGKKFPHAQFLVTGVLGPESNAHGPNEFLHVPTAKKLTACVAQIIAAHYQHVQRKKNKKNHSK